MSRPRCTEPKGRLIGFCRSEPDLVDNKSECDDNLERLHPWLKFQLRDLKDRRHHSFLKKKAGEVKIKMCRKPLVAIDVEEDAIPVHEKCYIKKIYKYLSCAPVPKMLSNTEMKIISFVQKRLRIKYPAIVDNYMVEVHQEFDRIIKAFSYNKILVPLPDSFDPNLCPFQFMHLGKTPQYHIYLKNRKRIRDKLLICYPFVRCILNFSQTDFPDILNDYGQYETISTTEPKMTLSKFLHRSNNDLKENSKFIRKEWYPKMTKIIRRYYKRRALPRNQWSKVIVCLVGLINRQINELKIRTFRHIREVLMDRLRIPYFIMTAVCQPTVDINPTFNEIVEAYKGIYRTIAKVADDLSNLEDEIDRTNFPPNFEYLKIGVPDTYLEEECEWLTDTLKIAYAPLLEYVEEFQNEYVSLYGEERANDIEEFLSAPRSFEEYLAVIDEMHGYIGRLRRRVKRIFFDMATVDQSEAIDNLRDIANNYIKIVTENIVLAHQLDCEDIISIFNSITAKALEIPKSTEELLDSGEYMTWVKTVLMHTLKERLQESLRVGGLLVELTELTQEHLDLQIKTINSFRGMKDVFDQNASQYEYYKSLFEEHLQTVTKKLNADIADLIPKLFVIDDMCIETRYRDYRYLLQQFLDDIKLFEDCVVWINKEEILFKFPKSQYPLIEEIKDFVLPFFQLMNMCIEWKRYNEVWLYGPFEYLNPRFVEETADKYFKEFNRMQKYYRNRVRQDMSGNPVCKFRGQTEDPDPENHPVPLKLCARMLTSVRGFRTGVRMVEIMCNAALRDRHWEEMSEVAGFDITPDAGTTLHKMLNYGILDKMDSFEIISAGANKELELQNNLAAMMKEWETILFPTGPYKETDIYILSSLDDIQALLDDHIIKALTMRGSAFVKPCEQEVRDWYDKLIRVNRTFEEWGKVQANWLYLLPIFSSKDIVAQMPEEGRLFQAVDHTYRRYIQMVLREPLVMESAPSPGLLEAMEQSNQMLDDITTGVNNYLEKKRLYFPRFFFLSNDEMLEILSETKDPLRVQPHLSKCFEGIDRLNFDEKLDILGMLSSDEEYIEFVTIISTVEARGSVEKWLLRVEEEMLIAVLNELSKSYTDYMKQKRTKWVCVWPQMVVLCISQVFWAIEVHRSLQVRGNVQIKEFFETLKIDLQEIVALIRSKDLTNLARISIKALIVIDVHAKDVVEHLIKSRVRSENDFEWLAQLRYYWIDGESQVKIVNATVRFANEYLGNSDRLVITPLTDRCYRTLVGAYQLHLNGAPEGPAGTGKTETTKDLAKALAVQCKVFNCSDGLDYIAMGKFFKGLASSGAWACFDEFNRIELEVLSVVAQQILCIIVAVRGKVKTFMFEGTELTLNPACYVCITMNPGYAGRSELPDNLKVLFRTVAMMVPDYAMIGEISLYSYGFVNARNLAVKIVTTYRLCSEQLSSQNHYDYGMRAVKTVLSACGNAKKAAPDENEDILLLRCLIDVNLPKFLSFDIPLFEGIISDLFPGVVLPEADYSLMTQAFHEVCDKRNLQPEKCFLTKIIETFEMMIVRHGFMMVGESYAGKSRTLKVLGEILTKLKPTGANPYYQNVQMGIMNPKSITMGQLYGAFDPVSYEWTDGIAATIFRTFAMDTCPDRKWLIFDGPVDAVWIENMNTVLDDNKKLCLTSGEVITMSNSMSMIFEVMDLSQASPATVSRCGMIYMEPVSLGWEAFFRSWLNQCNPLWKDEWSTFIGELFHWIIPPCMTFVRRNCTQLLQPGEFNVLLTTFNIFQMTMDDAVEENPEDYDKYLFIWLQATMIYSVVWGLGGVLDVESREKFDVYYRNIWAFADEEAPPPESLGERPECTIPIEGLFCEYIYNFKQKGTWRHWPDVVRRMDPEITPTGIQVHTIDTGRYIHLLNMHIKHKKKLLFVGPTGTGKSFYTQNTLMNNLSPDEYLPAFITFTVMITANQTQELIISKLLKLKRGIYGPPKKVTCVIFVDDMNMPAKEVYGAQPPLELLRQYFDYGHVYDLKDTSKLYLRNILVICACGLPGGSRQDVYSRFLCHFDIFSINNFSADTMFRIFQNVLLIGYRNNGHASDVMQSVNQIVSGTLSIYNTACNELRPTPLKSHYIFNLRDISRVCLGCSLLKKESVENRKVFGRIWFHETSRVFSDRLIDEDDRKWFFNKLCDCLSTIFREKFESIFETYAEDDGSLTIESSRKLIFGTYLDLDSEPGDRRYEEIPSLAVFANIAKLNLDEYNSTHKSKMDVVLFQYALLHLNKICRILSMPAGSSLLVGMGGSGRQSLTRLAATICQQSIFQPEITKNYGVNDWHEDLKKVLKEAGGAGKDTVFLFTENQIKLESFLTDIDCLLNLGEVPNIWPIDERQEILEMVRLAAQGGNRNIDISPLQIFSFFVNRCKVKLHIILCFSPIGSAFRTRVRLYPSLVNCCTIDWYDAWPEQALEMVAQRYMSGISVADSVKDSVVLACQHFHVTARVESDNFFSETGRKTYVTSASYLELIRSFSNLIQSKQKETMDSKMRYVGGLDTLAKAAAAVGIMQKDLNDLQPQLLVMAEQSRKMTAEIEKKTIEASIATEQVRKDEEVANVQAAAAQELKGECEKDLAQAIPVLEEALGALNTLKPADITLVRSMKNPPAVVKLVLAAVCVMKGIPPERVSDPATGKKVNDYWGPSKKMLSDMGFLQSLKDYDKDNIKVETMKIIRKDYIPHPDFKPHVVSKASSAAEGLCKWIIAMDLYDAVAKVVAPKKAKLEAAEKEFADTMAFLAEKRALAAELDAKVKKLNEDLDAANAQKKRVEDEVELCKNKLIRAESLIGSLGGERSRWTQAAQSLQNLYDHLPGDILISCGVIAYLAPFNMKYRGNCVDDWHKLCKKTHIPCSDVYSLTTALGSEIKIQSWNLDGLPRDVFSTENGIIMDNSSRYSLFVDPQTQANKWIKQMERSNRLVMLKFSQSDYMKQLESCIENGFPAIIENIQEELEAPLDPVLARNTFIQGGVEFLSIGDNIIPLHKNFRLYMTTSLRNPHYLPETFNKVTLINFALTQQGLEDQLLGIVVAKERPDLQELREKLIIESANNKATLKQVEDNILSTLSSSAGDILEDESAVTILDNSKLLSAEIMEKQAASAQTEVKIESFRQSYRPVAIHSSILYYSITDLPNVDPMYQFSLNWYINLYIYSIDNANKSRDLVRRLKFLTDAVTLNLYNNVCRSIFEKDKLLFSFVLTTKIMLASGQISQEEFMFLLTGGVDIEITQQKPAPWITDKMWEEICKLEQLGTLKGFVGYFKQNLPTFKAYYDSAEPHLARIAEPLESKLSRFSKMVVLRAIRPDKVFVAISEFVSAEMGPSFVSPPQFDISKSYKDSNALMPLIFILSPGADPMGALLLFAEKMGFDETFQSISLGQGQGPIAQRIIEDAQLTGTWVCLQNCHLAASWMPKLEYLWENMDFFNTSASFRMWLTSYPSDKFPPSILQNGVKMTNEPPTGLQQNLLRSYLSDPMKDEAFYNGCPGKDKAFTKLLYGICFFHAVVQERIKYGPLGWNIPYGFNESDFQISVQQLQLLLNQYDEVPYVAVRYLTGECNYGGRVTDAWDRRAIVTILLDYVNERVVNEVSYQFSALDCYMVPRKQEHREVCKYIEENIPNMATPEVFGLHANAGITRDLNTSNLLLNTMILTLGRVSSGGGDTDKILLGIVADIKAKLPNDFDMDVCKAAYPVDYNESMNTVLVQEMERFNKLLQTIRRSCIDLEKAVEGIIVMTPDLEAVASSILFRKIPTQWAGKSYPSLKPIGSYVQDFVDRLLWLQQWFERNKPPTFWLSGFFFTQAFLTGARQNYARKYRIPIDTLTFDFAVTKHDTINKPPEDGVYINGLYLDGASWNRQGTHIAEQLPKILIDAMPTIHLFPVLIDELYEGTRYQTPLYKTAERRGTLSTTGHSTNYVLPFLLNTVLPAAHWVKRSVAMLCQTSD